MLKKKKKKKKNNILLELNKKEKENSYYPLLMAFLKNNIEIPKLLKYYANEKKNYFKIK